MSITSCEICKVTLTKENSPYGWRRCNSHYTCDDCGTKDNLYMYTEGLLCETCHAKRVEGRIKKFKGDTSFTQEITCPWCGYIHSDSWECETGEYECEDCGRKYEVNRDMEITYSTVKIQDKP